MERCIENGYLRSVRHGGAARFYSHNVRRHMQRSEIDIIFDFFQRFVSHKSAFLKIHTAVEHAVSDGRDFLHIRNYAVLFIHQRVQHHFNGLRVRRHSSRNFYLAFFTLMNQHRAVLTDTFAHAFCEHAFVIHFYKLILK